MRKWGNEEMREIVSNMDERVVVLELDSDASSHFG